LPKAVKPKVRLLKIHGYPTVLVAHNDEGLRSMLGDCLRREGYHVLEAHHLTKVFDVVRVHSRPIHLVLVDVSMDAHVPILKKHRSELQVVFIKKSVDADAECDQITTGSF
jgi:DNA-binding NtrC family response regulator